MSERSNDLTLGEHVSKQGRIITAEVIGAVATGVAIVTEMALNAPDHLLVGSTVGATGLVADCVRRGRQLDRLQHQNNQLPGLDRTTVMHSPVKKWRQPSKLQSLLQISDKNHSSN